MRRLFTLQHGGDVAGAGPAHLVQALHGVAADVREGDHLAELQQGVALGRLLGQNIQGGPGQASPGVRA